MKEDTMSVVISEARYRPRSRRSRLPVLALAALDLQAGLTRRPRAGSRRAPAFASSPKEHEAVLRDR